MRHAGTVAACMIGSAVYAQEISQDQWICHNSFKDFIEGSFGDTGVNAFVTADGEIEMIHRWDLNNDGYLDLLVGQSHNTSDNEDSFIYWGSAAGPRSLMPPVRDQYPLGRLMEQWRQRENGVARLPSDGGGKSLAVDLNNDGWKDIVFCNFIHNHATEQDAYLYWGGEEGYSPRRLTTLPTLTAYAVAAADFNDDGFVDLCFANNGSERGGRFEYDQHLESYIYWNGPRGFVPDRRTSIASVSALDCAAGDLNGDGLSDLVLVNSHPEERSVFIYWNGPKGFSEDRREVLEQGSVTAAEILDTDDDGRNDLVVMDRDGQAGIYLGRENGLDTETAWVLPIHDAKNVRGDDLNQDGNTDLVFPNAGTADHRESYIYWGGSEGYDSERRTVLPGLWASDAAIADFNGDGWNDIVIANERDDLSYDVNSYLYWNGPKGFDPAYREDLQGLGPVSVLAEDLDRDGHADVALINRYSGATAYNETSPGGLIYWGNPRHHYSPAAMSRLNSYGDAMVTADFDLNGYVDIAFPNGDLFYGKEKGYAVKPDVRLKLPGYGVSTADINRDGYLDLLIPTAGETMILWGAEEGFSAERQVRLPLTTATTQAASIADLNKDGVLDLIFPSVDSPRLDIYWGTEDGGYGVDQRTSMDVHSGSIVQVADVNADDWLDLIIGGSYNSKNKGRHHRNGVLLYGGEDGYSLDNRTEFESYDSNEQVVADFNRDGFLDLALSNYHGYTTRSLPAFVYWGDGSGAYAPSRRTVLPTSSSLRLTGLDFNQDGWLDLAVFSHQDEGDHTTGADIFWGSPDGFSADNRHWIPAFGVHFGERHNLGNIYTRELEEVYVSPAMAIPESVTPTQLTWKTRTPHGTSVAFQVRSASSRDGLDAARWHGPGGEDDRYRKSPASLTVPDGDRWFQYRAFLVTPDGGSTPSLSEVCIRAAQADTRLSSQQFKEN